MQVCVDIAIAVACNSMCIGLAQGIQRGNVPVCIACHVLPEEILCLSACAKMLHVQADTWVAEYGVHLDAAIVCYVSLFVIQLGVLCIQPSVI